MGQRLVVLAMACVVGLSGPARARDQPDGGRTSRKVAALFDGHGDQTIDAFLMRLRPAPLDEASRTKAIASLPREGEVRLSGKDGDKLSGARQVLDYSCPSGAITLRVIAVDSAFVGLYYRTVVLVSARAVALLSGDELAALVAHETGHDADWNDYWSAMKSRDNERMRELELKADGIAVLTLEHLGLDASQLESAIRKMMRYNDWLNRMAGATPRATPSPADRYVSLAERLAFIGAIAKMRWADWPPTPTAGTHVRR